MQLHRLDYVLWFFAPTLQLGILIAMYRRRLHREYPFFFNYTILQVLQATLLFLLDPHSSIYFYTYWVFSGLGILVSLLVLLEIFKQAFRPYEALRDLSTILFRWSMLVVLLVAGMWALTANNPNPQTGEIISGCILAERTIRMMQCGLVFFLLLLSEYLGISRKHVLFGICLGFGIFASISLLVMTSASHHAFLKHSVLSVISAAAYDLAVVIWLGYTAIPVTIHAGLTDEASASQKWNFALDEARVMPAAESMLESMDETVERLLYARKKEAKMSVSH